METIRAYSRGSVVEGSRMSEEVHRMRTRIDLGEYTISNVREWRLALPNMYRYEWLNVLF